MNYPLDHWTEWLEADGLGGFASGTTSGERTRRYHALLLTATQPPTGRMALVSGFDAWVETDAGRIAISTQRYMPDVVYPDGAFRLVEFDLEPWPTWKYRLPSSAIIVQELFVPRGVSACCLRWRLEEPLSPLEIRQIKNAAERVKLYIRPLFCGRDYHSLQHENSAFRFEARELNGWIDWQPYDGVPPVWAISSGNYSQEPEWYRNFLYLMEQERGLDCTEDLASPGLFQFELSPVGDPKLRNSAALIFAADGYQAAIQAAGPTALLIWKTLAEREAARRQGFPTLVHRSADAYIVERRSATKPDGRTIIAGYPWFTDWGRDTFISLRGLCLAIGRLDDAREILLAWSGTVSEGMLPNRFSDSGIEPEFNSVDASLWFVIAVNDLISRSANLNRLVAGDHRRALEGAILSIVEGYAAGTRYGIKMDSDGLLAAGERGSQLTWMDVKIGDWAVTPRVGKPIEVQALWLNALWIASRIDLKWKGAFERGRDAFERRFWNPRLPGLFDVVDVDHQSGTVDPSLRPNQIFAVGGLPLALIGWR